MVQDCLELLDAERYEAAASSCESAFEESDATAAAVAAARAHRRLGNDDEILAWAARVGERDEATAILKLAAGVHHRRGDHAASSDVLDRAFAAEGRLGDVEAQVQTAYHLHRLAWREGDLRRALDAAEHIHRLSAATEDEAEWRGTAFQLLANVLNDVGDFERAADALRLAESSLGREHPQLPYLLLTRGAIQQSLGRQALARQALGRALALAEGDESQRWVKSTRLNLLQIAVEERDFEAAGEHLAALLQRAEADGTSPSPWLFYLRARFNRGRGDLEAALEDLERALEPPPISNLAWWFEDEAGAVLEELGRDDEARHAYLRAIEHLEGMRRDLELNELKASLLDRQRRPYDALARQHLAAGRPRQALAIVERAKARTFLDAFIAQPLPVAGEGDATAAWDASLRALERVDALRSLLPAMNRSKVVEPRPVDELLAGFAGHALIYFHAGPELWLLAIDGAEVRAHLLSDRRDAVERTVRDFLARPDDQNLARELGSLLLPPPALPPDGSLVHLVTDGELGRLPFAALRVGDSYLIERHALAQVPSLSALAALEERAHPAGERWVFGDPLGDLPAAAAEAREVSRRLDAELRLGRDADSEALFKTTGATLLHLATHTGTSSAGPWLGLSDRRVDAAEIVARGLGPEITVLASCASGARRGQGVWGSLAAAFLTAGSRTALASLWTIDDDVTRDFISELYRRGFDGDAARALARVQRRRAAAGEAPSRWAAFVLFGSGRPVS